MRILITWLFGYFDEFDVWEYGGSFSLLKHEFGSSLWDSVTVHFFLLPSFDISFFYVSIIQSRPSHWICDLFFELWIQISDARKSKIFLFFLVRNSLISTAKDRAKFWWGLTFMDFDVQAWIFWLELELDNFLIWKSTWIFDVENIYFGKHNDFT
ncbi:unnamed protein product [Rhizophagus irregularis]|nr:unnamed protein product [Rhizophagus irregularis]